MKKNICKSLAIALCTTTIFTTTTIMAAPYKSNFATEQQVTISNVAQGHVYIPEGTKFDVKLTTPLHSKYSHEGDTVEFAIMDNLIINGVIVIPQGTIGQGQVTEARKAGGLGRRGKLSFTMDSIKTINNIEVALAEAIEGSGESDGGGAAVFAAVSIVGGLFMKGTNIDYPAGTVFSVSVKNNIDLNATPDNLADVMNPAIPHGNSIIVTVQ